MENTRTIMVAEDEAATSLALCDKLEHEGYKVFRAPNGKVGLEIALKEHPDLILADLNMPEMGGLDMIHALRQNAWGKDAKVIILTNMSDVTKIEQAMTEGAFHYMVKGDSSIADIAEKVRSQIGPAK